MIMKHIRSMLAVLAVIMLLTASVGTFAFAAGSIDLDARGELIIEYVYEGRPVSGAGFYLYRVADLDEDGAVTLCGPFADYPVDTKDLSQDAMRDMAATLDAFAKRDALNPDYVAVVDEHGFAVIEDLEVGLYLISAEKYIGEDGMYSSTAALAPIPARQNPDSDWFYSVSVLPKCKFQPHGGMGVTTRKVIKIWDDKGNEANRPDNLKVSLLCNGIIYDTVELNAENGWSYVWTDLWSGEDWMIVEHVPEGYSVLISVEGLITHIKNTNTTPPPPPTNPPDTPQTGVLWWPMPILLIVGVVFIALGVKLRKGDSYEA